MNRSFPNEQRRIWNQFPLRVSTGLYCHPIYSFYEIICASFLYILELDKKEELLECGRLWMPCLMGGGWILCSEDQNKLWDLMFHSQSYKEKEMWLQYLKEVKRILECNIYQSFHIPNSHTIAIFNPRNFSMNLAVSPSFVTANLILHLSFIV